MTPDPALIAAGLDAGFHAGPDERARYDDALLRARRSAYPRGEFVGQESFMRASEILALARRAGIGPGVRVLDLCCGVGGPGRWVTLNLGCDYLGLDLSPGAVAVARERAAGLDCRFEVCRVPPVPADGARPDVVLLLETMLAFPDKESLLREVAAVLPRGGRFAFTVEEGDPLTQDEREAMPEPDTVWPVRLGELLCCLDRAGLEVRWHRECSRSHLGVVDALLRSFTADARAIGATLGPRAVEDLLAMHRLWSGWLRTGRVRKLAVVAEKL